MMILVFSVSCKTNREPEIITVDIERSTAVSKPQLDPNATYVKAQFGIDGMTCEMGCAKAIEKKIAKMDGVKSVVVNFDQHLAMVEYDEAKVTSASLEETVISVGEAYSVKDMKTVEAFSTDGE